MKYLNYNGRHRGVSDYSCDICTKLFFDPVSLRKGISTESVNVAAILRYSIAFARLISSISIQYCLFKVQCPVILLVLTKNETYPKLPLDNVWKSPMQYSDIIWFFSPHFFYVN